ncbi:hypothetical protein PHJA_002609600 [Phtheirospermum japonicum]|uniref:Uncharacterized protein n=1 Tax=Phtheirospermum japonicum TaxID=374723 RepID=A0A830DC99_9LAMI|nr:hypothetical protein PHJA_002609600 [Phtheirospermum japonicum]
MNRRSRSRSHATPPPFPSAEAIKFKLWRIVSRHEQLKIAFNQLHSQIRTGLLEAEEVFASLAIPLTKLVGLKTVEMAAEGRFSTIVTAVDRSNSQEENYMSRATTAGDELMERQKLQLMQLISLLKKIESQVNSSQKSIVQNLTDHQDRIKMFFLKALTCVSAIHQSNQRNDLSHMMLKILKATYDQVGVALGSVEAGIGDMICELAEKMCNPMVEYVNGLKVEIKAGTCSRLLDVVKEMDGAMKVRDFELDKARKQVRLAEQSRIEALSKLMKSEETARKMAVSLGLVIEDSPKSEENLAQRKSLSSKDDQAKDENLLWELLRNKRKCQVPDSPLGPKELLGIGTHNKKLKPTRVIPTLGHRPVTRSCSNTPDVQSSFIKSRMLVGSSPSAMTQKHLPRPPRNPPSPSVQIQISDNQNPNNQSTAPSPSPPDAPANFSQKHRGIPSKSIGAQFKKDWFSNTKMDSANETNQKQDTSLVETESDNNNNESQHSWPENQFWKNLADPVNQNVVQKLSLSTPEKIKWDGFVLLKNIGLQSREIAEASYIESGLATPNNLDCDEKDELAPTNKEQTSLPDIKKVTQDILRQTDSQSNRQLQFPIPSCRRTKTSSFATDEANPK